MGFTFTFTKEEKEQLNLNEKTINQYQNNIKALLKIRFGEDNDKIVYTLNNLILKYSNLDEFLRVDTTLSNNTKKTYINAFYSVIEKLGYTNIKYLREEIELIKKYRHELNYGTNQEHIKEEIKEEVKEEVKEEIEESEVLSQVSEQEKINYEEFAGTRWYYRLEDALKIYKENKDKDDRSVIIARDYNIKKPGAKQFAVIENQDLLKEVLDKKENLNFHEYYPNSDRPIYFYCDIDCKIKDEIEDLEKYKFNVLFNAIKYINEQFIKHYAIAPPLNDISVWDSSSDTKVSFHVSYPYAFKKLEDLKSFAIRVFTKEKLDELFIDNGPYLMGHTLRLPYQSKVDKDTILKPYNRFKIFNPNPKYFNLSVEEPKFLLPLKKEHEEEINHKSKKTRKSKKIKNLKIVESTDIIKLLVSSEILKPNPLKEFTNEVEYYLSCIPNHGQGQSYHIWLVIGMVLSNIREDIKLWIDWSNQCPIYGDQTKTCKKYWEALYKNEKKGYKIGTLIKIAFHYVPKELSGFQDKILNQVIGLDTSGYDYDEYEAKHVKPYPLEDYDILVESSPMGTGKTYQAKQYLIKHEPKRVLFFSPRIIFSRNIEGEFKEFNFKNYKDGGKLHEHDRLIISIESIHKLDGTDPYDLLIIDEIETILSIFLSDTVMLKKECIESFDNILKNAKKILMLDAFLSNRTIQLCKDLFLEKIQEKKILIRKNKVLPVKRIAYQVSLSVLQDTLIEHLNEGKKVVIASQSNTIAQKILENKLDFLKQNNKKYKLYHGKTDDKEKNRMVNVKEEWKDLDLLIYTPTITVGVNYDIPDHFDHLYVIGCDSSTTVRDTFQSSMRVRHLKTNEIYYTHQLNAPHDRDGFLSIDKVRESIEKKRELLSEMFTNENFSSCPLWLKNVLIHSKLERNISSRFYKEVFENYLTRLNYDIVKKVKYMRLNQNLGSIVIDYDSIDKINRQEYDEIKNKIKSNQAETKHHYEIIKFDMLRNYKFKDRSEEKSFWDQYVDDRKRLMIERVREELLDIIDHGDIYIPEAVTNMNIVYKKIKELCDILGFEDSINSNDVIINDQVLIDNKERIEGIYNNLKKIMNIVDKKKYNDKTKKTDTTKQDNTIVKYKINALLSRWSGVELKEDSVKRVTINGKRVRVRTYKTEGDYRCLKTLVKRERKETVLNNQYNNFIKRDFKNDPLNRGVNEDC